MYKIRTTKTKSKATAVQVVLTGGHEVKVVKHIGSSKDSEKITALKVLANNQATLRIETMQAIEDAKKSKEEADQKAKEEEIASSTNPVTKLTKGVVNVVSKTFESGSSRVPSTYVGSTIILGITCAGLISYLLFFRKGF